MLRFFRKETLYPWVGKKSIYQHIKDNRDESGQVLDGSLPDDEDYWEGKGPRWVAGGLDGALSHHAGGSAEEAKIHGLVQLIAKQSRNPNNKTRRETYLKIMQENVINNIDALLTALFTAPNIHFDNLYHEAYWMAEHGTDRNVVKLGIAILGQFQTENHKQLLMTVGRHDEFTLYAAVAIHNSCNDPCDTLFELAQAVKGWGKIHLVERLEPATPEIKSWLIRHGFRNQIMIEYLACVCARNGELHVALSSDHIDVECFDGSGEIITALIFGGPAEDMDDYEHASATLGAYLQNALHMSKTLPHLSVLVEIMDFLDQEEERWDRRYENGWRELDREKYKNLCSSIISKDGWDELIQRGLQSENSSELYHAIRTGKALDWDIWPVLFRQLQANPFNQAVCFELMRTERRERAKAVVDLVEQVMPLSSIATGPADELGLGPEFEMHRLLSLFLQNLDRFEGIGVGLLQTGLKSPVVNNRSLAVRTLESWSAQWMNTLGENLVEALANEPDHSVKERLENLLKRSDITK